VSVNFKPLIVAGLFAMRVVFFHFARFKDQTKTHASEDPVLLKTSPSMKRRICYDSSLP